MAQSEKRTDLLKDAVLTVAGALQDQLGPGLTVEEMEKHFVAALDRRRINITRRNDAILTFSGKPVEKLFADVILEGRLMVEIKRLPCLTCADLYRFAAYLRSCRLSEGVLINLSAAGQDCFCMNVACN